MKLRLLAVIVACLSVAGLKAHAHHAFAQAYLLDQHATIDGKIVEFTLRNPHSFVVVAVTDRDGKTLRWGIEWGGVAEIGQMGVTRTTLKVGDEVKITGAPAKAPTEHRLMMQKIVRPADGWGWEGQLRGYSPIEPNQR
jgi:hypothetical protein